MSDNIPPDVYREILRRVPVNSLFLLRSVCKSWRSIIDDPEFPELHIHRGIGEGWIIHVNNTRKIFLLPLSHLIHRKTKFWSRFELVDATNVKPPWGPGIPRVRDLPVPNCNGLILIASSKKHLAWVIWNPFTGESLKLPICDEIVGGVNTVERNDIDRQHWLLGYDEVSKDYKVVRIVRSHTFICSVSSGTWRRLEDFPFEACRVKRKYNGAFVNGALHWIAYTAGAHCRLDWLVALDLSTETYRKIPMPSITPVYHDALGLVALSGCLFLYTLHLKRFTVWMIKDYDGSDEITIWNEVMSLEMDTDYGCNMTLMGYLKSKNCLLLHCKIEMFAWYDVEKKHLREFTMGLNSDVNGNDQYEERLKYFDIQFPLQVIPVSLVRLKRTDGANEGAATAGETSTKRKRKRVEPERLRLKVFDGVCD